MKIIEEKSAEAVRRAIEKELKSGVKIIVKGRDIEFNRKVLENKKVNALILSHKEKKDKLYQRDSGLNHVLCKIALQNSITFIIDLNELLQSEGKERAEILSRIMQNIKLIRKFKNKLKIINYKDVYGTSSLLLVLGLPTDMVKKALG